MRQVAGLISTYSSDEFGICSALYELGGMVVMHDASGCNSTYTTHDEPRWYDMDSMIYISAISEMEAIMGDDEKLIRDLTETALEMKPKFVAVVGAPIPYMIGTDLPAIAAITEQETGIPCMGFAANGMNYYTKGVSMALEAIVRRFCTGPAVRTKNLSVNILGATPLDFSLNGSVDSIKDWIRENGMDLGACLSMGSTLEDIAGAGRAHVNLVVSYGGLAAARYLKEQYGIPYVVGVPFGEKFPAMLAKMLKEAASSGKDLVSYRPVGKNQAPPGTDSQNSEDHLAGDRINGRHTGKDADKTRISIIGESVFSASLAAAIELDCGIPTRVLCPLDTEDILLRECDLRTPEEDDLMKYLPESEIIVGDPMYRVLCGKDQRFCPLPHEAFSGRIYDPVNPNLVNRKLTE